MIKGSIQNEDITVVNIYAPNIGAQYIRQTNFQKKKKFRDTKGSFHAKMGSIKDRNGVDLTGEEGIKNRWQEYTGELYK